MSRSVRIVPLCLVLLLAACAAELDMSKVAPEKEYRTGSNIAQRDHALPGNLQTRTVDTADPNFRQPLVGRPLTGPGSFGGQ